MPMRNSMRLSAATPLFRSGIAYCTSTAQRTASTTLANSTSRPSPVVLTMRPRCSAIFRIDNLAAQRFEAFERPLLVHPHQPRIARDIGGEDRGRRHVWLMSLRPPPGAGLLSRTLDARRCANASHAAPQRL